MPSRSSKQLIRKRSWRSLPLWKHQIGAVELVEKYLASGSRGSALVHMPTGTGKTGVIAVISCCFRFPLNVLILTPWQALQRQMTEDLSRRFWRTLNHDPSFWAKNTFSYVPSALPSLLKRLSKKSGVLVGTIQGLRWLYEKDARTYQQLRRSTSLVIVDEGHYEPAPEWGNAVRSLACPTVLLSATPYRNDLKVFNIDPDNVFSYSFHQAAQDKVIRGVEFQDINTESAESFVDDVLRFYNREFQKTRTGHSLLPKVIVRCQTFEEVQVIAGLLATRGESVIAVHERFISTAAPSWCKNVVPDPRANQARFWVHQFKLMEGVDNPDFEVLAIFRPFRNARAFVQQVGRVIRNPQKRPGQTAYILADKSSRQREFWKNYIEFEKNAEQPGYFRSILEIPIHRRILDAQKGIWYIKGNFRSVLKPGIPNIEDELLFRQSILIMHPLPSFSFRTLCKEALALAKEQDREIVAQAQPGTAWLNLYIAFRNSPLLHSKAFIECELGYTFFWQADDFIFCFDSQGLFPDYLGDMTNPVAPTLLQRLFPQGSKNRLFELSLVNTDLGRHSVRARTIRAYSIADTAPSISDYAHFCSRVSGFAQISPKRRAKRYVGLARGRVTDSQTPYCTFNEYMQWLERLLSQMRNASNKPNDLFSRYAQFAEEPKDPEPRNILFDIADVIENFITIPSPGILQQTLECEDLCFSVDKGRFTFIANGHRFPVAIHYDKETGRYLLNSPPLDARYISPAYGKTLVTYFNQSQSFRVVPKTRRYIYAHGQWYLPSLHVVQTAERLMKLFHPVRVLDSIATEKGRTCGNAAGGWQSDSLFGLVDRCGHGTELSDEMSGVDLLVCDDMKTEVADFIAADTHNLRLMFIHAKAFATPRKRSASSFHEVCSQAVKNLELLHPYSDRMPPNLQSWIGPWEAPGVEGQIRHRIRKGPKDSQRLWNDFQEMIRDPTTARWVWIILGHGFSLGEFRRRIEKRKERPEDVQIIYLVQSTWNAVSSIGAQLKFFCSP